MQSAPISEKNACTVYSMDVQALPRVLVVDDYPDFREMLVHWLGALGFSVRSAANGHEALRVAAEMKPHVVLMDLFMPVMDGFEATRVLRETPATSAVPIVAVSATASDADRVRARQSGATAFVGKPVDLDVLVSAVVRFLPPAARRA